MASFTCWIQRKVAKMFLLKVILACIGCLSFFFQLCMVLMPLVFMRHLFISFVNILGFSTHHFQNSEVSGKLYGFQHSNFKTCLLVYMKAHGVSWRKFRGVKKVCHFDNFSKFFEKNT